VPGKTTATIDRERRDALYELVLNHVNSIGDLWVAMEEHDFPKAERLGIEYGEDLRLMQDLGWPEEDGRESVDLTMAPGDLMELLSRLRGEADCVLTGSACVRMLQTEEENARERYRRAKAACEELIEHLDPRKG
jgi:hypothetical protein